MKKKLFLLFLGSLTLAVHAQSLDRVSMADRQHVTNAINRISEFSYCDEIHYNQPSFFRKHGLKFLAGFGVATAATFATYETSPDPLVRLVNQQMPQWAYYLGAALATAGVGYAVVKDVEAQKFYKKVKLMANEEVKQIHNYLEAHQEPSLSQLQAFVVKRSQSIHNLLPGTGSSSYGFYDELLREWIECK